MRKAERFNRIVLSCMIIVALLIQEIFWPNTGRLSPCIAGFCGGYLYYVLHEWWIAYKNHKQDVTYIQDVVNRMNEQKWLLDWLRMVKIDHPEKWEEWKDQYIDLDISQCMCQYYLERINARTEMMSEVAMKVFIGQGYRDISSGTQKTDKDKCFFKCFLLVYGRWDRFRQYPIVIDPIGHVYCAKLDDELLKHTDSAAGCYSDKEANDMYKPNYYFDFRRHESFMCLGRELMRLDADNDFNDWAVDWIYDGNHDRFHEAYPDDND